jgi:hypothetical protein
MDCPHCGKAFHDQWKSVELLLIEPREERPLAFWTDMRPCDGWIANATICPACKKPTIDLVELRHPKADATRSQHVVSGMPTPPSVLQTIRAYPTHTFRKPTPKEVPAHITEDYEEACRVLPISHKASAALSRRCLQAILQRQGYTQKDLAIQTDALLKEADPAKAIPTALRQTVDAVRNFGNFSAHRITDQTTLQVIKVEPGEAEWCIEILEDMFDHYYVKPAQAAARKAALDAKLAAAGKPRSK